MLTSPMSYLLLIGSLHILSVNVGGSILPAYIKHLGGSDALVGHIIAAFFLVRGTLTVSTGTLLARIPPRRLLPVSLGLFTLSQYLYILCERDWHVFFCVMIQAVGAGLYWPTVLTSIASSSRPELIHRNQSRFFMVIGVVSLVASWIGGRLAQAYSPRLPYLVGAILFSAPFVLSFFFQTGKDDLRLARKQRLRDVAKSVRPYLGLIMLSSLVVMIRAAFYVGYALRLITLGGDYETIGTVYGLSLLSGSVMLYFLPRIEAAIGIRATILSSLLLAAAGLFVNALGLHLYVVSVAIPVFCGAMQSTEISWLSYIQQKSGASLLGVNTGFLRGLMDWMTVIFSMAFGLLSEHFGVGVAFLVVAMCLMPVFAVTRKKLTLPHPVQQT